MTLDTAWHRFLHQDHGRPPPALTRLLRALEEAAPQFNLDASAVALAADLAGLADADEAAQAGLVLLILVVLADVQRGSTRTPIAAVQGRVRALLISAQQPVDTHWQAAAALLSGAGSRLIGRAADARLPVLHLDGHLYLQRLHHVEVQLAARLGARLARPPDSVPTGVHLDDVLARPAFRGRSAVELSEEQVHAVDTAMTRSLTLVSGGPGTGKTSIVVAMLRLLARLGVEPEQIALAAPTGKAAWRMGESIAGALQSVQEPSAEDSALLADPPTPRTLHRLLGYSPNTGRFRHDPDNPLAARAIVVDEGSMVDVFMMERLLAAARPTARLIILGDAEQLPSVAAGAVFRDALQVGGANTVRLTRSYRMRREDPAGRSVLTVANRICVGDSDLFGEDADGTALIQTRPGPRGITGAGVEHLDVDAAGLRQLLDAWYRTHVERARSVQAHVEQTWRSDAEGIAADQIPALEALFEHLNSSRILCLTRGYDTGARRANAHLHQLTARAAGQPEGINFLVGEPVMMLHNDYDRLLFNGDQGVVLWVQDVDGRRRMAVFPRAGGGFRGFPLDALSNQLELAYAMTVHKSQGSEFDAVAVILPADDLPLLTRELLYTAVTRSRHHVLLVGRPAILAAGVGRGVDRESGLVERIAGGG